ncbi:unnamed protein product [Cuscuta campestris]|uniref:Reverse transcriptase domain-containing protein n=1 Tax=Cuscuta campestris TaxID=132261 RepID=A0A484M9A2_9ASTE|nr:unnamed protein product [Cuscuta campestris]
MKDLLLQPHNQNLLKQRDMLRKKASFYFEVERAFFQQKVKTDLIVEGDKCTKYFHALMRKQNATKSIPFISTEHGGITTSLEEIAGLFTNYYKELYGSNPGVAPLNREVFWEGLLISPEQALNLVKDVHIAEVKEALFSIRNDKAPGPDGFTSAFFQN